MKKTVIIDDQLDAIKSIERLISKFPNTFDVIGRFQTVDEGVLGVEELKPDLVFLDVEIHNETGFDFLERVRKPAFQVVFTTAFSKYAVRAFQFSALHYLLKPIDMEDFIAVVDRLNGENSIENLNQKIETLLHNDKVEHQKKKIIIDTSKDSDIVSASEILYCLSDGNYTEIYTIEKKRIVSSKTLRIYEEMLLDFEFFRVDQTALVNLDHIKKYTKGNPTYVIMSDGKKIKVSTYKKPLLIKKLRDKY